MLHVLRHLMTTDSRQHSQATKTSNTMSNTKLHAMTWTIAQHFPTHGTRYEVTYHRLVHYILFSLKKIEEVRKL